MARPSVIYMAAMSLDGFIARKDGSVDWLDAYPADAAYDFEGFLATVGGIVMGRDSYEVARRFGDWPYGAFPVAVATSRPLDQPPPGVTAVAGSPESILAALAGRMSGGRVWLFGGGRLAGSFLSAGLVDTIELGVIPVLLGEGIPAFGPAHRDRLALDFAKPLDNGVIHARWSLGSAGGA